MDAMDTVDEHELHASRQMASGPRKVRRLTCHSPQGRSRDLAALFIWRPRYRPFIKPAEPRAVNHPAPA